MSSKQSSIEQIVFLFKFIGNTSILPRTLQKFQAAKNFSVVMFVLMLNFLHRLALKLYKYQELKIMKGKYRHIPNQSRWSNDYPIVLVHGYMGYGPDSSYLFGNYF
mmetsp:Transcript_1285/g.1567  ORF Transcript_1285/g.1567 Transcript_1285/m.1567 type:complete len:106 (+) Transcript_1285:16-333(+)